MIWLRDKETLKDEEINTTSCPCSEVHLFSIAFQIKSKCPYGTSGFFTVWPDLTDPMGSLNPSQTALQPVRLLLLPCSPASIPLPRLLLAPRMLPSLHPTAKSMETSCHLPPHSKTLAIFKDPASRPPLHTKSYFLNSHNIAFVWFTLYHSLVIPACKNSLGNRSGLLESSN